MLFCCVVGVSAVDRWTDGVCDDVLDVVEGNAGETVIELMQEEKGIKEICDLEKKMYMYERIRKMRHIGLLDVPKSIATETTLKKTHEKVGINQRYVHHKEMCI